MWWRFRKHKLAVGGTIVLVAFYLVALFADFFAYVDPHESDAQRSLIAPQTIHWFDEGSFSPYVYALKGTRDPRDVQARLCSRHEHEAPDHVLRPRRALRAAGLHPGRPPSVRASRAPRPASRCS